MVSNHKEQRVLVTVIVFNEGGKLRTTLKRFPENPPYDVVVMDDGSSDGVREVASEFPFAYLRHEVNSGVGASLRTVFRYAEDNGYDIIVVMAGNAKMHPSDIPNLLKPIREDGYDYVQGSRYLSGSRSENLPLFRKIMIPLFTWFVRLFVGYKGTDVTCGMRAYRLEIVKHPRIDITQPWLDRYEMEYYIHYYAIKLGYRLTEAPVSMTYPPDMKNYSKIRAITGWWSMIRPWVYLVLHLRR
ncbi:MAG: glycosyltransferase [candidate division Zixibacteria bacterium]|nr:glycosyltransferase [candidate division Zixibacteria bacterium]